jgi:hypothetical protein
MAYHYCPFEDATRDKNGDAVIVCKHGDSAASAIAA